jgi:hypothetical protein
MNLSVFSKFLDPLYKDSMIVQRYAPSTNADGTTSINLLDEPIYKDIPCHISTTQADNAESSKDDTNPQFSKVKVFCPPKYHIQKGDRITAAKKQDNGDTLITYTGTANLPLVFVTHQEIELVDVGDA